MILVHVAVYSSASSNVTDALDDWVAFLLPTPRLRQIRIQPAVIDLTIRTPKLSVFPIAEHIRQHYSIRISRALSFTRPNMTKN
jgi:hypothetical protein